MSEAKHKPMVVAAARAMCRLSAEACGIDNEDNWKIYGHSFLEEAEQVLTACGAPALLEALRDILRENVLSPEGGHETVAEIHCIAREALKLTGSDE